MRGIGAEIKRKLPTYNNFTTSTVSLLPINISFCDFSYISLYLRPTSAAEGYLSFIGHQKKEKKKKTKQICTNWSITKLLQFLLVVFQGYIKYW